MTIDISMQDEVPEKHKYHCNFCGKSPEYYIQMFEHDEEYYIDIIICNDCFKHISDLLKIFKKENNINEND